MARSGLIVEVAAAEPVVQRWRNDLDPQARLGVPAHVTVLRRAEQEVQQHLPIRARAGTVALMVERPDGRWHRHTDFDLAG